MHEPTENKIPLRNTQFHKVRNTQFHNVQLTIKQIQHLK